MATQPLCQNPRLINIPRRAHVQFLLKLIDKRSR